MDLHDSPAEATFRAEARAFLSAHAHEGKLDYYEEEVSTPELLAAAKRWQRTLYESGWAALHWPERYGGRGLGPVELIIWNQELGRAGVERKVGIPLLRGNHAPAYHPVGCRFRANNRMEGVGRNLKVSV